MISFFEKIIAILHELNIPYMLSGSVAMSLYIVPRATRDFDFIIHLESKDIDRFIANFEAGYYCDKDAIQDAINRRSMFNIIDHASGFKADFVVLKSDPFRQMEFSRKVQIDFYGQVVYVVSVEDLLISKLIWIQTYQSPIQMEDIKNLASLDNLDWGYIKTWIDNLKLNTFNLLEI
ncbi:DUF6036 family nucleotidyltransferase [Chitinophaga sp. 22321]|uniref:DUF6036 domain-containing protein n=1 Tax=Chitinophaga hostae TaxID=2831022 RepID=A0ABS5JAA7_9BACT|nr:DUF6036 family nucleotidyltransferase [Chitinophaga hostae]MBS0031377.1 hypothetical protein [Chitinophaga hostae]